MANYRSHVTLNLTLGLPALVVAGAYLGIGRQALTVFALVFVYGTLFAHPDMDMAHRLKVLSIRGILGLPFRSYAHLFKHRGLSHSFLLGTFTRVVWIAVQVLAILYVFYAIGPLDKRYTKFLWLYRWELGMGLAGLMAADWCHLLIDKLWPARL